MVVDLFAKIGGNSLGEGESSEVGRQGGGRRPRHAIKARALS